MCGCLSCAPYWGPGPQPRHVPWLGLELATLWSAAHTQSTGLLQPGLKIKPLYTQILNHYTIPLKLIQCYLSIYLLKRSLLHQKESLFRFDKWINTCFNVYRLINNEGKYFHKNLYFFLCKLATHTFGPLL